MLLVQVSLGSFLLPSREWAHTIYVEAVGGDLFGYISSVHYQFPKGGGGYGVAWELHVHADDGYRCCLVGGSHDCGIWYGTQA